MRSCSPLWRRGMVACLTAACACAAPEPSAIHFQLALPQEVACAAPPTSMQAQVWLTGDISCPLQVEGDGAVRGTCEKIPAGIDRRAYLDFFLLDLGPSDTLTHTPYRLLLAQAVTEVPLEEPHGNSVELRFAPADFVAPDRCRDVTRLDPDTGLGSRTTDDFAPDASPCDVDDDGASNLEELCAEPPTDPYDAD